MSKRTIHVPPYLADVIEKICINAAQDLGRRVVPHEIVAAALLTAHQNGDDFHANTADPALTAAALAQLFDLHPVANRPETRTPEE